MKFLSSSRSLAFFALSFINLDFTHTFLIDPKAGKLERRYDGYPAPASFLSSGPLAGPTRRRKTKCSGVGTGTVLGAYSTGSGLKSASPEWNNSW